MWAVDGAWLRMDSPTNPMMITAVMVLDCAIPHAHIEALVVSSVPLARMHGETDPGFDLRLFRPTGS